MLCRWSGKAPSTPSASPPFCGVEQVHSSRRGSCWLSRALCRRRNSRRRRCSRPPALKGRSISGSGPRPALGVQVEHIDRARARPGIVPSRENPSIRSASRLRDTRSWSCLTRDSGAALSSQVVKDAPLNSILSSRYVASSPDMNDRRKLIFTFFILPLLLARSY